MPGKNTKHCNGCYEQPIDRSLPVTILQNQPFQTFCCDCIPKQICLTVENYMTGEIVVNVFNRDCTAVPNNPIMYSGYVTIDQQKHYVEFIFKIENNECYFCLRSPDFGITEDCILVDAIARGEPTYICYTMTMTFHHDVYTFSTSRADNIAINYRHDCINDYGERVRDVNPIKDICGGCGCICKCACIISYGDNRDIRVESACINADNQYVTASGIIVSLHGDYDTQCCVLELVDTGDMVVDDLSFYEPKVNIGTSLNPCPSPTALWSFFAPNRDAGFIAFLCSTCGGCPTFPVDECCDGNIPATLTAVIDAGPDCPCGSISVPLVIDPKFKVWRGFLNKAFCGHSIELELSCNIGSWRLNFNGSPCTNGYADSVAASCNPLFLTFAIATAGIGCCGDSSLVNPTLSISVF